MSEVGVVWMQCLAICSEPKAEGGPDRVRWAIQVVEGLEAMFPAEIDAYAESTGLRAVAEKIKSKAAPLLQPAHQLRRKTDLGPLWSVRDKH
jgi:hypothetical protein